MDQHKIRLGQGGGDIRGEVLQSSSGDSACTLKGLVLEREETTGRRKGCSIIYLSRYYEQVMKLAKLPGGGRGGFSVGDTQSPGLPEVVRSKGYEDVKRL